MFSRGICSESKWMKRSCLSVNITLFHSDQFSFYHSLLSRLTPAPALSLSLYYHPWGDSFRISHFQIHNLCYLWPFCSALHVIYWAFYSCTVKSKMEESSVGLLLALNRKQILFHARSLALWTWYCHFYDFSLYNKQQKYEVHSQRISASIFSLKWLWYEGMSVWIFPSGVGC